MPTQEERTAASRAKLHGAARRLFRSRGYAATSIDDITARAGMTKGAFYHHFEDKQAIFRAVFEEAEQKLMEAATAGARGSDAWGRFRAGCRAFLEASVDPGLQRIALRDGPAVLGWETWRDIDARYSLGLIEGGLRAAMEEGHLSPRPTEPLARLVFGALCEGARFVARAENPAETLAAVLREVDAFLAGLAQPIARRKPDRREPVVQEGT